MSNQEKILRLEDDLNNKGWDYQIPETWRYGMRDQNIDIEQLEKEQSENLLKYLLLKRRYDELNQLWSEEAEKEEDLRKNESSELLNNEQEKLLLALAQKAKDQEQLMKPFFDKLNEETKQKYL